MEKNSNILPKEFIESNINVLSSFALMMLKDTIHSIILSKENDGEKIVYYFEFEPTTKFSNHINIVHGGSQGILYDNLSNMCLYHLTHNLYNTIQMDLVYKNKMQINKSYIIKIAIERLKCKTVFISCKATENFNGGKGECSSCEIVKTLTAKPKL